jgi:hypothetical protein
VQMYYHTTHRCGHQVWWSDLALAQTKEKFDCPWCGAETNNQMPPLVPIEDAKLGVTILPNLDSAPIAGEIFVQHRADEQCCSGTIITRASREN